MNKEKTKKVLQELNNLYPNAKPQLVFNSEYQLLIAVILSAQCTDERVNKTTKDLFLNYGTPEKMATLTKEELALLIKPCGLNNSKAEHILSATKDIISKHNGQVPQNFEDLIKLSGVGRKTADVMIAVAFNGDAIAVDTHVFRVANRLGLAKADNPYKTELQLMKKIDKSLWSKSHHYLIYHGRQVCKARKPDCVSCTLYDYCEYKQKSKR